MKYGDIFSRGSETKKSEAVLNVAQLQALRDFLAGRAIQGLQDSYFDNTLTTDYASSMEIEINVLKEPKRIVLPHLHLAGEHNSKIYPSPVHDQVCKVYGLEERVGIHYAQVVSVDPNNVNMTTLGATVPPSPTP